ncbi:MAG TPA: DUF6249 domain-containing protein [Caulobacteraceae bacterium]|nr:DUF6249 domain-containing protein [Caulobacteraceae bacterium]
MFDLGDVRAMTGALETLFFWGAMAIIVLGVTVLPRYIKSRERTKLYEVMRTAYEKGQPVPPELIASLTSEPAEPDTSGYTRASGADRDLRRALVLIAVGLGLGLLGLALGSGIGVVSRIGGAVTGGAIAGAGAIPAFIGLAYLLLYLAGRGPKTPPQQP